MKYLNHIKTLNSITIILEGRAPATIFANHPVYTEVEGLLKHKRFSDIPGAVDKAEKIRSGSNGLFDVRDGDIVIDGTKLPDSLSKRILQFCEGKLDCQPLVNFWYNLRENPSEDARRDLYTFLEKNHVPITEDGSFIAYKKVRSDFMDCHSGTVLYKVGTLVKMPRDRVNSDRHTTCAPGLHVAGWDYMSQFSGDLIIEAKVNPKNVVAVPTDYNFTKIRVCELEVIQVCEGYMENQDYNKDTAEKVVEKRYEDEDGVGDDGPAVGYDDRHDGDDDDDLIDDTDDDDDDDLDLVDDVVTLPTTIRRIPPHLRIIKPNQKHQLKILNVIMDKINLGPTDVVHMSTTTRKKKLILSAQGLENDLATVEIGTTSVTVPAKVMKLAGLTGRKFKIKVTLGTLEITPA